MSLRTAVSRMARMGWEAEWRVLGNYVGKLSILVERHFHQTSDGSR